ncbi:hypothetical protein C8J57DRAFT_1238466 [Mycena rebaudengoi]|nr:hypothetical protein C8J57DRAFT_1238466 [Mycena rebaudengoi]
MFIAPLVSASLLLMLSVNSQIVRNESIKLESVLGFACQMAPVSLLNTAAPMLHHSTRGQFQGALVREAKYPPMAFVWTWSTGSTQTVLNYKSGNVHPGTLFFTLTSGSNIQWNGGSNNKVGALSLTMLPT